MRSTTGASPPHAADTRLARYSFLRHSGSRARSHRAGAFGARRMATS